MKPLRADKRFPYRPWELKYIKVLEPALKQRASDIIGEFYGSGIIGQFLQYLDTKQKAAGNPQRDYFEQLAERANVGEWDIDQVVSQVERDLWSAASKQAFAKIGAETTWNVDSPEATSVFASRHNYIKKVDETHFAMVKQAIFNESVAQGGGIVGTALLDKIQAAAFKQARWEAERIARTEVNAIQNEAAFTVYKKNKVGKKQWQTVGDDAVRDGHAIVNNEVREMGKVFSNGMMYPGDPSQGGGMTINCRCALIPIVEEIPDTVVDGGTTTTAPPPVVVPAPVPTKPAPPEQPPEKPVEGPSPSKAYPALKIKADPTALPEKDLHNLYSEAHLRMLEKDKRLSPEQRLKLQDKMDKAYKAGGERNGFTLGQFKQAITKLADEGYFDKAMHKEFLDGLRLHRMTPSEAAQAREILVHRALLTTSEGGSLRGSLGMEYKHRFVLEKQVKAAFADWSLRDMGLLLYQEDPVYLQLSKMRPGALGEYSSESRNVRIKDGMTSHDTYGAVRHELTHALDQAYNNQYRNDDDCSSYRSRGQVHPALRETLFSSDIRGAVDQCKVDERYEGVQELFSMSGVRGKCGDDYFLYFRRGRNEQGNECITGLSDGLATSRYNTAFKQYNQPTTRGKPEAMVRDALVEGTYLLRTECGAE